MKHYFWIQKKCRPKEPHSDEIIKNPQNGFVFPVFKRVFVRNKILTIKMLIITETIRLRPILQ